MKDDLKQMPGKFFGYKKITENNLQQLDEDHYKKDSQYQLYREKFTKEINQLIEEKQIVFLEYLSNILSFSIRSKLAPLKISSLLEISAYVFINSFIENLDQNQSLKLLEKELVRHSLNRPPSNIFIFTKDDLEIITWFFINNLYRHYSAYENLLSEAIDIELNTVHFSTVEEPKLEGFEETELVNEQNLKILREYLVDKETGLTQQELDEIMKGDSIHQVPKSKREEWIKLKKQREMEMKIQKAMDKELEKLNAMMEEEIKKQDQEFMVALQSLKDTKKKK